MMDISERITALETNRQRAWHEARNFLADLPGDSGEWSQEQRDQWTRYNTAVDQYDADIRDLKDTYRREQEDATLRETEHRVFGAAAATQRAAGLSVRDWLRGVPNVIEHDGQVFDGWTVDLRGVAKEREMLRAGASWDEVRDLAWDATSGSLTVPTTLARSVYQKLEANVALFRMPVTRITTASGNPMNFDRIETHSVATQAAGQGSSVAVGTDTIFGQLSLTPDKWVETIKVASELITDNEVGVEEIVGAQIGRAIGRVVDNAEIGRMLPATGLGSVNTGGSLIGPTYDKLVDVVYSVNDAYRNGGSAGWLFRDSTAGSIRKIRDGAGGTEGSPLWQPGNNAGLSLGQPPTLLDFPAWTDPNVASMASNNRIAAFGDWNGYFFRTVGNVVIDRSTERYFDTDQIAFRGRWRTRGGYQDTGAVILLKQNV
jgi:HK97 family phage major capsid protein